MTAPRYHQSTVSNETLQTIRDSECLSVTDDVQRQYRFKRLFNELEFLAQRLARIQNAVSVDTDTGSNPDPWPCPVCGSDTIFENKRIHYTDCSTGLG